MAERRRDIVGLMEAAFRRLADQGRSLTSIVQFCADNALYQSQFYDLLERGARQGAWELERDGVRIMSISCGNGTWRVNCAIRPRRKNPGLPSRNCLGCRKAFSPSHRFNFMCWDCANNAAIHA